MILRRLCLTLGLGLAATVSGWGAEEPPDFQECKVRTAVQCACPAAIFAQCGKSDSGGFVDNDHRPAAIDVAIFDPETGEKKVVTLWDPPQGLRGYYGGLENDAWVKRALALEGIKADGKRLTLEGFANEKPVKMYEDPEKRTPRSKDEKTAGICVYEEGPQLLTDKTCKDKKICLGQVKCMRGLEIFETAAACPALPDGTCPRPTNCANDPGVAIGSASVMTSDARRGVGAPGSGGGSSGRNVR